MPALRNRVAWAKLGQIVLERSYLQSDKDEFVLASGRRSRFYFDCKRTTFYGPALELVADLFLERIDSGSGVKAVGGLTQGSDPIALAVSMRSQGTATPLDAFSVRKSPKEHGTRNVIENVPPGGTRVVVVDDVVTSGNSVVEAIERCRAEELIVAQVIVLVDREAGGLEKIRASVGEAATVNAVFDKTELDDLHERMRRG